MEINLEFFFYCTWNFLNLKISKLFKNPTNDDGICVGKEIESLKLKSGNRSTKMKEAAGLFWMGVSNKTPASIVVSEYIPYGLSMGY